MRQVAWQCFPILQRNKVFALAFTCLYFDMLLVRSFNGHRVTSLGCRFLIWSPTWDMVVGLKGQPAKQLRCKAFFFLRVKRFRWAKKIQKNYWNLIFFSRPQASKELGFKKTVKLAPTEDTVRNSALFFNFKAPGNKIIYIDLINVRLPNRMHGQTASTEKNCYIVWKQLAKPRFILSDQRVPKSLTFVKTNHSH